ncbi:uncharacterized protein BKCO1_5300055 [Diplodia corticola]|uniref:Uncharacterized protein n=1 Tax=Diplodia corticola TaxID=236234 RepID=A0A1J9RSY4_9PEZI|nr:uncharacterized protein BKCO1_5300055 [Diplodia corticola]OJD30980.1 hypothetical protein BKCO1_5300055 [Diplodia corticola]
MPAPTLAHTHTHTFPPTSPSPAPSPSTADAPASPSSSSSPAAHTADIYHLAITSHRLISCSRDRSIRVWDLAAPGTQYPPAAAAPHASSILCVSAHEATDRFATCDVDGWVVLWRLSSARVQGRWRASAGGGGGAVLGVALGGEVLVTGGKDGGVGVWDVREASRLGRSETGGAGAGAGAGAAEAGSCWDDSTPPSCEMLGKMKAAAIAVVLGGVGERDVYVGAGDGALRRWRMGGDGDGEETTAEDFGELGAGAGGRRGICSLALSRDGRRLFSAHSGGKVGVFDVEAGAELMSFDAHGTNVVRSVRAGVVDGGEELLVSGSYDGTVKIWVERERGAGWELVSVMSLQQGFEAGNNRVLSVAFRDNVVYYCGQSPYIFARRLSRSIVDTQSSCQP